ncbi:MAG: helix-turn-helix transcriptional regulator [Deltaproteobacteria bacterium]|nr:helix-turn-helix transcriptional regulator [Deltaproteobacteria bacterium]MBK8238734.1 helix-turn-helix transcriptional regulator [Deltaproteobacteria bacterium]MBK8715615.1 helix-turn-helix transcriptional regulator [Deltaproteobacteria bacterium]MBP7287217.1 helix-turn-helix transcriptional regulator [Nannocystaceae bacterium]
MAVAPAETSDGFTRQVGERLHAIRRARGYSLDELAALTGVSKGTLSQIETGGTNPTLGVLWRICDGLGLPFASMLGEGRVEGGTVVRKGDSAVIRSSEGELASRPLTPERALGDTEIYELHLAARSTHVADAHAPGTREGIIVVAGVVRIRAGSATYDLGSGDTLSFAADVPHSYENPGRTDARMYNVIVYGRR